MTQAATRPTPGTDSTDILTVARQQVLERGEGLSREQVLRVLQLPDDRLEELLALAHEARMAWCGPEVEVEGIISLKTGGCPEDCHFCSQSGLFASPVINPPEVGILAIGKIVKRPVYDADGHIRPADMIYLSFSFDHRVIDGAVGAVFANALLRHLQNPAALLLPAKL